jgi:predicted RNA binding protein YcfA (HicA-like mRNA interferase family)
MGSKLKTLSSKEIISILETFGFFVHTQKGSHIKLRCTNSGVTETLMIPERKQVAKGTLRDIFKQATLYIPTSELRPHFYTI